LVVICRAKWFILTPIADLIQGTDTLPASRLYSEMSYMPSFDVVCKPNLVELRNAVDQANREISNRFDFKGSDARVELAELQLVLYADDDFKLGQVRDVLLAKLAKRSVDARFLKLDAPAQKISGDKLKQEVEVRSGLEAALAKRVVQLVKDSRLKLTASIQGDAVRIAGAKKDTLQQAIAHLRGQITDVPIGFDNFRD
jgi:uncharacterized protein YajQ (UPF0234 family)